jgi:hypothetical protein
MMRRAVRVPDRSKHLGGDIAPSGSIRSATGAPSILAVITCGCLPYPCQVHAIVRPSASVAVRRSQRIG